MGHDVPMPGWPRLVLVAIGMGIAAINGIQTSDGNMDLIGGVLILAAVFWPGCEFTTRSPDGSTDYSLGRCKIGWVSSAQLDNALRAVGGQSDGIVFRNWTAPFPVSWCSARDYSTDPDRWKASSIHTS